MSVAFKIQTVRPCPVCGPAGPDNPADCENCDQDHMLVLREAIIGPDDVAAYVEDLGRALAGEDLENVQAWVAGDRKAAELQAGDGRIRISRVTA